MVKRFIMQPTKPKGKPTKNEQVLLSAIDQQKATIQKLKDEIEQLRAEIETLKNSGKESAV